MQGSMTAPKNSTLTATDKVDKWFEELVHAIHVDKLQILTGTADERKAAFYKHAISGNIHEAVKSLRKETNKVLIDGIIQAFLVEIASRKALPKKLALSHSPATILVWAEIADSDHRTEDEILLAESRINAQAKEYELNIDTMIVEESDKIEIPSHYISVKLPQ
jgi:hypothetical protein